MSTTPAMQSEDVAKYHACHVKLRRMSPSATPATQSGGDVCETWCVTKMYVKDGVCEKNVCVCGRCCVTKLCVKDGV